MKIFDYKTAPKTLLTPDIVAMLTSIHEHKGKQELYIEAHADILNTLIEIAKVQSTGASNRIEGIHTSDKRLEEIVKDKSAPRNRTEQEIAGYRDVLATIHESYDYVHPRPNIILQLHRQLYSFAQTSIGGSYKNADNFITETDAEGNESTRFTPVPAYLTANAMESLCAAFIESIEKNEYDALLLIPMFILDFQKIYEDNASGKLSDKRLAQLSGSYEQEQASLKEQSALLQDELNAFNADGEKAGKFIEVVRRYTEFDELSNAMLNEFIQKILVHEADKSSGERVQEVDVYFNFIGNFTLPK